MIAVLVGWCLAAPAQGPDGGGAAAVPAGVTRVEEDWELHLGEPDEPGCGPQLTTTMSPVGDTERHAFTFNLNYRDDPFRPGGLQVRAFDGKHEVASLEVSAAPCVTPGETVRWTQRMTVLDGVTYFRVFGGTSTTWGSFGAGEDPVRIAVGSTAPDLDAYRPEETVANSGAGFQPNRVHHMTLLRVRYYRGNELLHEDATPRDVVRTVD
jgi:hypothetical protein